MSVLTMEIIRGAPQPASHHSHGNLSFGENNKLGILEYLVFAISLMYLPVLGPSSQAREALHLVLSRISDSPQSCLSCRELEPVELRDVGGRNQFPFRWTEETDDITHLLFRLSRLNQYPDWLLLFLLAPFREIHCRKWTLDSTLSSESFSSVILWLKSCLHQLSGDARVVGVRGRPHSLTGNISTWYWSPSSLNTQQPHLRIMVSNTPQHPISKVNQLLTWKYLT